MTVIGQPKAGQPETKTKRNYCQNKYVDFSTELNLLMEQKQLSQNKLSICIRTSQSKFNRILNGKIDNVSVELLMGICLVMQLSIDEALDLMALRERALPKSGKKYSVFEKLTKIYKGKNINFHAPDVVLSAILDDADEYFVAHGLPPLPNENR